MIQRLPFIFCLFFLITSCGDKKSPSEKLAIEVEGTHKVIEKNRDSIIKIPQNGKSVIKEELKENKGLPIVQEELIPYLTQYGKDHPEHRIRIKTSYGDIEVSLYRDTPLHRANFILLTNEGYFNDTYFHRVAPGFVIQGGNSDNRSTSKKRGDIGSYLIPSEFNAGHQHTYGSFSAAKYSEQNVSKASSPYEFFIVMAKNGTPHLNNDHTVFGKVTKGMDVAEKIAKVKTGQSEWPIDNIQMKVEIIK